jgi:hypothetical protein
MSFALLNSKRMRKILVVFSPFSQAELHTVFVSLENIVGDIRVCIRGYQHQHRGLPVGWTSDETEQAQDWLWGSFSIVSSRIGTLWEI